MTTKLRHFPARTENMPPWYVALCGYESDAPKEFCNPAKPEQVTCEACRNYDHLPATWTMAIQPESE